MRNPLRSTQEKFDKVLLVNIDWPISVIGVYSRDTILKKASWLLVDLDWACLGWSKIKSAPFPKNRQDGRVGPRRTVQVHLIHKSVSRFRGVSSNLTLVMSSFCSSDIHIFHTSVVYFWTFKWREGRTRLGRGNIDGKKKRSRVMVEVYPLTTFLSSLFPVVSKNLF